MPKPSLCTSARVARPLNENITSVGALALMPSSWHIGSPQRDEQAGDAAQADQVAGVAGLLEHAFHALEDARALVGAPDQQVGQPRVLVDPIGPLVQLEAWLQTGDRRLVRRV